MACAPVLLAGSVHRAGSKPDEQIPVVGLYLRFMCGTIAHQCAAAGAAMPDDISLARVRFCSFGFHQPAAGVGTVSGENIHMQRVQAERAVIPGRISQRKHRFPTVGTYKSVVIFLKSFGFHGHYSRL